MRRAAIALFVPLLLLLAGAARADDGRVLGADGEVYSVQRGLYKSLFASPPAGWGGNVVLALDIRKGGKLQRVLVPGTDGPEKEESPSVAIERATNQGFVVWTGDGVLNLIGFGDEGWGDIFELSGDPGSAKRNPQLTTTVDQYHRLGPDGELVAASRTILHLVWFDQGTAGDRVLYTPLVVEDGNVLRSNRIFDLAELIEAAQGSGLPGGLHERPQVRGGGNGIAIGFVPPGSDELVTLELRSIAGELAFLADKARAVIIDTGRSNPGLSRGAMAEKARAVIIDTGRRLLKPTLADVVVNTFLATFAASDQTIPFEKAADAARGALIEEGVALRIETAGGGAPRFLEIARGETTGSTTHLLDVRPPRRRALPELGDKPARIVLSPTGAEAVLAWTEEGQVSYRETGGEGWSGVKSLTLDGALDLDQAFTLLEQRLDGN